MEAGAAVVLVGLQVDKLAVAVREARVGLDPAGAVGTDCGPTFRRRTAKLLAAPTTVIRIGLSINASAPAAGLSDPTTRDARVLRWATHQTLA